MQKYNKLVRDKIPEIIKANGETPITRTLDEKECKKELLNKLGEECEEVKSAQSSKDLLEECADVLEVIFSIGKLEGSSEEELIDIMRLKRIKRGGFDSRIYLESVEDK